MAEKKRSILKTGAVVLFGGLALVMVVGAIISPAPEQPAAAPAAVADCNDQAQREALIARLGSEGYIHKVEYRSIAEVWVTPQFMALDFDTKQSFSNAVAAASFCKGNHDSVVALTDAGSGKPYGTYSPLAGLRLE